MPITSAGWTTPGVSGADGRGAVVGVLPRGRASVRDLPDEGSLTNSPSSQGASGFPSPRNSASTWKLGSAGLTGPAFPRAPIVLLTDGNDPVGGGGAGAVAPLGPSA